MLVKTVVLRLHLRQPLEKELVLLFDLEFFSLEFLDLEPLAFAGSLRGGTVPKNTLYPPLLLLIFGLGSFSLHKSQILVVYIKT